MTNYQKPCFFWDVLPIIEWNIQAKHTSLTAESDSMFYLFSLDLLMVFLWAIDKKKENGIIIWECIN